MTTNDEAQLLLQQVVKLVGADGLGDLLQELASGEVRTALARLHGSVWWVDTLKKAVLNPRSYDSQLICKLLDKAVPTPQSVRVGLDESFKLTIQHSVCPKCGFRWE